MGTSVATEVLARDLDGRLPFRLAGGLLFNGSMVIEAASLTLGQKVLRSRLGPVAARLSNERLEHSSRASSPRSIRCALRRRPTNGRYSLTMAGNGSWTARPTIFTSVSPTRAAGTVRYATGWDTLNWLGLGATPSAPRRCSRPCSPSGPPHR
jgi:hypothetical protein